MSFTFKRSFQNFIVQPKHFDGEFLLAQRLRQAQPDTPIKLSFVFCKAP